MADIISQMTVFDYGQIEMEDDLGRLGLALSGLCDDALVEALERKRGHGRNDYPVAAMWNAFVAMKVFGHRTTASFCRELRRNAGLRKICGFNDCARKKHLSPPERVFSGFLKALAREQGEIDNMFASEAARLAELMPGFGRTLAGDGKYLDSYAKHPPKNPMPDTDLRTENDAAYSVKEYKHTGTDGKTHSRKETHYGFKAHMLCDTATELPVACMVTAANYDEKKAMKELLAGMDPQIRGRAQALALDRGYDSTGMIQAVKSLGISPVIDIRNCWKDGEATKQYKDTDIVYDCYGNVYIAEGCVDGSTGYAKMEYEGYDRQKGCLRYSHKGKMHRILISHDERVFLPIARDSRKFKRLYKMRTSVERLNGRLDRDFMFEDHCIRGLAKMRCLTMLSLIVMNAMAIGKLQRGIKTGLAALTKAAVPQKARAA